MKIKRKNGMNQHLMPANTKVRGLDRIHPARPSFGEIEMTRIVGKMTGEKVVEHSEAIMIASIQKLIE
jgi:hypothetical protein